MNRAPSPPTPPHVLPAGRRCVARVTPCGAGATAVPSRLHERVGFELLLVGVLSILLVGPGLRGAHAKERAEAGAPAGGNAAKSSEEDLRRLLSVVRGSNPDLQVRTKAADDALAADATRLGRSAFYAGRAILADSPKHGVPLIRAGLDTIDEEERISLRETVLRFVRGAGSKDIDLSPVWALAIDLGALSDAAMAQELLKGLLHTWPLSTETKSALRHSFALSAEWVAENTSRDALMREIESRIPVLRVLERATADDPQVAGPALDELVGMGKRALPVLHDVALQAVAQTPERKYDRSLRAVLALGFLGDASSIDVLAACLASKTHGWLRARAAVALGDSRLPAAAPALAWHLCVLSDLFRSRDQWDYPGPKETTLTAEEWPSAPYFSVDAHAADALLRLGIPRAAGYLIEQKLNPAKANYRVRVLQDAVDALRRNVVGLDISNYNVDQGTPQRTKAYETLRAWWRDTDPATIKLRATFDESDAQFAVVSDRLSAKLLGRDAREFIITKAACALLGKVMTPSLLRTLAKTNKLRARCELAVALGRVVDPRAIDPLIQLARDRRETVRAKALEALSAYAHVHERVQKVLLDALAGSGEAQRVAAMKALVMAPKSPSMRQAIHAAQGDDPDFICAKQVALFIQGDDSTWSAIELGLSHKQRVVRRTWWALLKRGLALPATMFNATAAPGAKSSNGAVGDRTAKNRVTIDMVLPYRKRRSPDSKEAK